MSTEIFSYFKFFFDLLKKKIDSKTKIKKQNDHALYKSVKKKIYILQNVLTKRDVWGQICNKYRCRRK